MSLLVIQTSVGIIGEMYIRVIGIYDLLVLFNVPLTECQNSYSVMSDKVYHVFEDIQCIIINYSVYELITHYYVPFFPCMNLHISLYIC